jgi:hypothetical protein
VNRKALSESDICDQFITPSLVKAGWDSATQIRREVSFTKGRIIVRGKIPIRTLKSLWPARLLKNCLALALSAIFGEELIQAHAWLHLDSVQLHGAPPWAGMP